MLSTRETRCVAPRCTGEQSRRTLSTPIWIERTMPRQRTGHVEPIIRALYPRLSLVVIALFGLLWSGSPSIAKQRIVATLPDAPTPKQQPGVPQEKGKGGFSRTTVLILSRRSFFFPDLAYTRKPLNSGQKFLLAADVTVAPSDLIVTA